MTEPKPELLEACKIWLEEYIAGSVYWIDGPSKLAEFVQAREQAAHEQWEEEMMGLRERIIKLVTENDRLEDHIVLLSHAEPKEPR